MESCRGMEGGMPQRDGGYIAQRTCVETRMIILGQLPTCVLHIHIYRIIQALINAIPNKYTDGITSIL